LRSQITTLEEQLDTLAKANDEHSSALISEQIQPLREERDAAQQAVKTAEAQFAKLTAQLEEVEKKREQASEQARLNLQTQQQASEQSVEALQTQLSALESEKAAIAITLSEANTKLENHQAEESTAISQSIEPLQQQIQALQTSQEKLTQELTASEKATAESEKSADALRKQLSALAADKASLEEAMKLSQEMIVTLQKEVAKKDVAPNIASSVAKVSETFDSETKVPEAKVSAEKVSSEEKVAAVSNDKTPAKKTEKKTSAEAPSTTAADDSTGRALEGKIFVLTGKLSNITYEQITETVTKAGGRINKMPSSKTDYIVVGENPGSKLKKAVKCKVQQLNEAQLLELFATL
ncbi:MAG: BRCT domain-containing protein, partial [Cyanobacteria bacterium J06621_11]